MLDPKPQLAYARWLTARGVPHGELIEVQHALAQLSAAGRKAARGKALARRQAALLAQYERFLAGISRDALTVSWRRGFLERVEVDNPDGMDEEIDGPALLDRVFGSRAAIAVEELAIGVLELDGHGFHEQGVVGRALAAAARHPASRGLRSLSIGSQIVARIGVLQYAIGPLGGISRWFPALTRLHINGWFFELGRLALPELRELVIETPGLPRAELRAITRASWPSLERLSLWFGAPYGNGDCTPADLAGVLAGQRLPRLRHLCLRNAVFSDELCALLPRARVLPQLATLDLAMGTLSEVGARALAAQPAALAHLEALDVSDNYLTGKDLALLRKIHPNVSSTGQKTGTPRRVTVSDH